RSEPTRWSVTQMSGTGCGATRVPRTTRPFTRRTSPALGDCRRVVPRGAAAMPEATTRMKGTTPAARSAVLTRRNSRSGTSKIELAEIFRAKMLEVGFELLGAELHLLARGRRVGGVEGILVGLFLLFHEQFFGREDRRIETHCDGDTVGGTRVDPHEIAAAIEVQLGVIRVLLDAGDLHAAECGAKADDHAAAQIVCQRTRAL